MQKLILGTAQFGQQPYGIKGDPVPDEKEIEKIAHVAWDGGIRIIHTSWQYNLPKICEAIFNEFEWIRKSKDNPKYFFKGELVGLSEYDPVNFTDFPLVHMYQIPVNILDKRFLENIIIVKIFDTEIHARSVFLQGLLLMNTYPTWLSKEAKISLIEFEKACNKNKLQRYEVALGYVLGLDEIDKVIVGVNSADQLKQLLAVKPLKWDYDFSITDENVLDPRRWPK